MINKILNYIRQNNLIEDGDSVILGVSGGADSICLLHVLQELQSMFHLKLTAVHVNHHIRGEEAERDAKFVEQVCAKAGVDFRREDLNVRQLVKESGKSEEEAGRDGRYEVFFSIAREIGTDKIATAHNLNDNSETLLFHLFRGTGLKGLLGIPAKRGMIVRPLLCCTRDEIEDYLKEKGVEYRMDSTNLDTKYSRNKIRLELIPYLKENINAKVEYNIVNAAKNLSAVNDFVEEEIQKAFCQYVEQDTIREEGFSISPVLLEGMIRSLIKQQGGSLKDVTKTHIMSVKALKDMQVSRQISLPHGLIGQRTYHGIRIRKQEQENILDLPEQVLIVNDEMIPNVHIQMQHEPENFEKKNIKDLVYTKWIDYDKINKLVLRRRKKGDFIVIDDRGSRKKLKDYFIDRKIPQEERDRILLLADGSHVVWIIGYRLSAYYKITEKTKHVIQIHYKEN